MRSPPSLAGFPRSDCCDRNLAANHWTWPKGACGIDACVLDELNDIDYGSWQFKTHEEVRQSDPVAFAAWFATPHLFRFPNGDSLQDLVRRTSEALRLRSSLDMSAQARLHTLR